MNLSSNDLAIIEQALRDGMNHGYDYQVMLNYRSVLSKLQGFPTQHDGLIIEAGETLDGFRYDHNDSK